MSKRVYLESGVEVLNNYELLNFLRDKKNLKCTNLLVALCLATRRSSIFADCFPSKETIMRDSGLTKPTVNKIIRNLESLGVVIIINHGWSVMNDQLKHNGIDGNHYYFCYDLEYQGGLVDDDMHPLNKDSDRYDNFKLALSRYERGN